MRRAKNDRIFNYFTTGCNRDGLAIRAWPRDWRTPPANHKLVILLSDVKPNDVIQMNHSGSFVEYAADNGIQNTAMEIRSLTYKASTSCAFSPGMTTTCTPPTPSMAGTSPASVPWTSSPTRWVPSSKTKSAVCKARRLSGGVLYIHSWAALSSGTLLRVDG